MKKYLYRVDVETIRERFYQHYEFDEPKSKEYIIGRAYMRFGFNGKGSPLYIKIIQILEIIKENNEIKGFNYYCNEKDYYIQEELKK